MNSDTQPLGSRISGEFLVRRKRRRSGVPTDPELGFYVPSSPTSVDVNPSSETAEPRSASSEHYKISPDPPQRHSPIEVENTHNQPPVGTPMESHDSLTPTPRLNVKGSLRKSVRGGRKRQKLKHVGLDETPRETSPASHHAEEHPPPTITQPLTSTAPRRKRKTRSRFSRVKTILVKGKAYRARSQKPKAVTDDLVRTALSALVDADEEFLEDGRRPQRRLGMGTAGSLTQNTPATPRRRNLVHPSKTQPFLCEPSLGNTPVGLELGRHPRKPLTAWEGALALSKLDIQMPTSTVTPRRKGRPIQGSSTSRMRGRYPKLPLTPLSPTPKPTSRGHPVPRGRLRVQHGVPGQQSHPEVTAIPIISAEEITSPNSEPGSEHEFGSSALNPAIQASDHDPSATSNKGRARVSGAAVMHLSRAEPRASSCSRKVRFSSPLASDPEGDIPDDHPVVLVPNSSDPNLASRHGVSPDPSNHVSQSPEPPSFPSPRFLFIQSHPHSGERTLGYHVYGVDSDVEREPRRADALVPPITVSTQSKTANDNKEAVPGGSRLNYGKNLKGREEGENVDQPGAGSPLGSQGPAETFRGNVQDSIEHHSSASVLERCMRRGDRVLHPPAASQPADIPHRIEDSKLSRSLESYFDGLADGARQVESRVWNELQAEVEGDAEDNEVSGAPKEVITSNWPPHSAPFPLPGKILSPLDESGPSRSLDGFGRAITRRPRRSDEGNRYRKLFQTQPPVEVESRQWQSEGVDARPGAGASKSDDLSFFAGL